MKNKITLYEGYFRNFFGLVFPVVLTLGLVFAALQFSDAREAAEISKNRDLWQEKAEIILASVRSNHTFSDMVTEAGNRLAKDFENDSSQRFDATTFARNFNRHFTAELVNEGALVWFFRIDKGQVTAETAPGLSSTRLRVMQKLFSGILEFANNKNISQNAISSGEKFIKGVLGFHSAPLSIGRRREGQLTPVTFEGKKYFFYWRQFLQNGKPAAGTTMLFPASPGENIETILQMVSDRVLTETRRHIAVAFIPSEHLKDRLNRIFPLAISRQTEYLKNLNQQIDQLWWLSDDKGNRVHEIADHLFLRGFLTADMPYDAVIFAPRPQAMQTEKLSFLPVAFVVFFFWGSIYLLFFLKNGRIGLPLAVSFRILFFFSGLLPIFVMLSAGFSLIEESYNIDIHDLRQANSARLYAINEKSDNLLPLFGYHISEMLKNTKMQGLLNDGNSKNARQAFDIIRSRLADLELSLDYMYVLYPGISSDMLIADERIRQSVKVNMSLTTPGIYSVHKEFSRLSPQPEVKLDAGQANFYKILSGLPNSFLEDSFFLSYEKENFLNYGSTGRDYYYTVILSKGGKIASYIVFAADSENLFRDFLVRELNTLNIHESHLFLAAEQLENSDFSIFPAKKLQPLQGQMGKNALNFLKKCRSSIFEKYMTDRDHLYLSFPLSKMPRYSGGCIISLAAANRSRQEKRLFLIIVAVLLVCLMYVTASFATAHMLLPLARINFVLQRISAGNLDQKIDFERNDELGQLGGTINLMLNGFKERLRLGKFVSTTLDQSLSGGLSLDDLRKARVMTGTVLFSDIRNFTSMSEKNPPAEIAAMLNAHLEGMSEQIQGLGGQVEQFIGDAIVAFFPDKPESDSRLSALKAALAVNRAHRELNALRAADGKFSYAIGIGLQHGEVIAGSLVTPERCEFSIIGEARHQAEEFEALSKLGTNTKIIVSGSFIDILTAECVADYQQLPDTDVFELVAKRGET